MENTAANVLNIYIQWDGEADLYTLKQTGEKAPRNAVYSIITSLEETIGIIIWVNHDFQYLSTWFGLPGIQPN